MLHIVICSTNLVYNIVTGDETWIYSYEPESKQQSTVWVFQNEPKPTKVVRSRSAAKQMIACFFGYTGHVTTVALEDRRTVNTDWYTTICLPEVINELRRTNRNRRIILHHDNASCHTARQTVDFLSSNNVELMIHCPYSPDLSPNDFFLFPKIKNKMRVERFESPEAAVETFRTLISEVTALEWKKCFENWFERMQKCINLITNTSKNNKAIYRILHVFFILFAETFPAAYVCRQCKEVSYKSVP